MSTTFRSYTHFAVKGQQPNSLQMSDIPLYRKMFSTKTSVKTKLGHHPTLPEASL